MIKVTIDRAEWDRGYLWDLDNGCGCALGHCLRAAGVDPEIMDGLTKPDCLLARDLPESCRAMVRPWTPADVGSRRYAGPVHSRAAERVAIVNDYRAVYADDIPDEREAAITEACRAVGFEVAWAGEYRTEVPA